MWCCYVCYVLLFPSRLPMDISRPRPRLQDLPRGPGPPVAAPVLLAMRDANGHGHGCTAATQLTTAPGGASAAADAKANGISCDEFPWKNNEKQDGKRMKRRERFIGYDVCDKL